MSSLHIRNLDDAVVSRLKARAARNRRSLQGELKTIIEAAADPEADASSDLVGPPLRLRTVRVGKKVAYSRNTIYADDDR